MNEYLEEKKNKRENVFSIIFVIYFIASIIAMFICGEKYMLMIFGQLFFVFGILALFLGNGKGSKFMGIPFILVGFCCVVIPYCMAHPEIVPFDVRWDYLIVFLVLLAFVIAGLCMIFIPIFRRRYLNSVCNYEVKATIIRHDVCYNKGSKLYCPVYGFWYNGKDWEVSNHMYTNVGVDEDGKTMMLMINPDNPEEFLNVNTKVSLLLMVLGISFIFAGIFSLFMFF